MSGTTDRGLLYRYSIGKQLVGYIDADWAGDATDHRSTSGFMFSHVSVVVAWSSKKQSKVALSSTEARYIGATVVTCEAIWLWWLLQEL